MNLTQLQMDALNHCVKCSICVDSCPVTKVEPRFPGPKQLGVDWLRIVQETQAKPNDVVEYCSNCKTCESVCPSGVHIATLNQLAKSKLKKKGINLRERIFSDPSKLGKLIHIWPQVGNFAMKLSPIRFLMEKMIKISAKATMPAYSAKPFRKMLYKYESANPFGNKNIERETSKTGKQIPTKEVLYFPGCFTQYNKPEVGIALVKILAKLNYKVIVPEFSCCGQPSISNAQLKGTRKFAERNLELLKKYHKKGMPILFTCPSCLLTFKEEYKNILGMEEFSQFNSAMFDAGLFLAEHDEQLRMLIEKGNQPSLKLAYHEPCHLKASGQGTPGLMLLRNIANQSVTHLEAGCCGLSGSYGLKLEKHWISDQIGKNIKDQISNLNPQAVVTECGMCSVQINQLSGLPVYHPLEILAEMIKN